MIRPSALIALATHFAALTGCEEKKPLDPELGKIRPAAQAPSAPAERTSYTVTSESAITVSFGGKADGLEGRFPAVSGKLDVDLMDLSKSRGSFAVDLLSARFTAADSSEHDPTREAVNWLGLGADRPRAERDFRRHATATVFAVEPLGQTAAYAGKLVKSSERDESVDAGANPEYAELRSVRSSVRVDLTLNARRATLDVPVTATFRFTEPALTGAAPDRIVVQTRSPVSVELSVFDVVPRDSRGTVLSNRRADALRALRGRARVQARLVLARSG